MSLRDTLHACLAEGTHWLVLVPARLGAVAAFLLETIEALGRPDTPEVQGLQLWEVDPQGRACPTTPLILVAIPREALSRDELHRTLGQACGGSGPPPQALTPHGFIVPLTEEDLWPVGEAIKVFNAWLDGDPGTWEEDLDAV